LSQGLSSLLQRFNDGDPAATEELARRACWLALRTAAMLLRDREEAGDVAQDVAVEVLRSLEKLRDPEAFDAWVHRIAVRRVMRALRKQGDDQISLALVAESEEPAVPEGVDPALVLGARQALAVALMGLSPKQRLAIALRYVHDLPDEEIAKALGCRLGTAQSMLFRARAALRANPVLADFAPVIAGGSS
jgi:RNA polymerase sigma-70 factor, ECF subfamily